MVSELLSWLWFILVPLAFLGIAVYVFRPGARRRWERDARMPLEDEGKDHGKDGGDRGRR